jgi:hypothetical protein
MAKNHLAKRCVDGTSSRQACDEIHGAGVNEMPKMRTLYMPDFFLKEPAIMVTRDHQNPGIFEH